MDSEIIDRSIAKNDEISLLRNPENGDRPINDPQTPIFHIENRVDRDVDRGSIAGLIDPPVIENEEAAIDMVDHSVSVGDIVIPNTSATWHRRRSTKIESAELPPSMKSALVIPINKMRSVIFEELRQPSKVLEIISDEWAKVRNQTTARDSVFAINDVQIYRKATSQS